MSRLLLSDARARRAVIAGARALSAQRLVVGTTGNVSARAGERVWITPTRMPYARLRPRHVAVLDLGVGVVAGRPTPSTELPLHLAIYRTRPDVGAVVHCHSPHATAWSFLGRQLAPATEDLGYHGIGEIGTCAGGPPGSLELAASVARGLRAGAALLIPGHGVVTVASTVESAVARAAAVEHVAQIAWLLRGEEALGEGGVVEHALASASRRRA